MLTVLQEQQKGCNKSNVSWEKFQEERRFKLEKKCGQSKKAGDDETSNRKTFIDMNVKHSCCAKVSLQS